MNYSKAIEELGPAFYDLVKPAGFPEAKLRYWNQPLCDDLTLSDDFADLESKIRHFQKFEALPGSLPSPLALRYHGHQFHHYNPDLGDGRGFLFAQILQNGKLWDWGTKGSGSTPWSRGGDGRLTLKGAVREILATEMLDAMGVRTSRTWSVFETGEQLQRNDEPSPTRSAVLTRFSHSHIRIGSFQRLAYLQDTSGLETLLRYCARHLLPELNADEEVSQLTEAFYLSVCARLARLAAQWMNAGFVHGVLNTDNLNITGESFDYGPYRFLPEYDPQFTAAYFDQQGLYSYGRQPNAVAWSLGQLAQALFLIHPALPAQKGLDLFAETFTLSLIQGFCHRLNIQLEDFQKTTSLLRAFYHFQESSPIGFEKTFFELFRRGEHPAPPMNPKLFAVAEGQQLLLQLAEFQTDSLIRARHPALAQPEPVTLLIDQIEALWEPIALADDWGRFESKITEIRGIKGLINLKEFSG